MSLVAIGALVSFIGNIMLIVAAFREAIGWGVGVILVPLVGIVFLVLHWESAKKAFQIQLLGASFIFLGVTTAVAMGARDMSSWVQIDDETNDDQGYEAREMPDFPDNSPQQSASEIKAHATVFPKARTSSITTPSSIDGEYVGMTLEQARSIRGDPKGVMQTDGKIIWLYDKLELVSSDGINVTAESWK